MEGRRQGGKEVGREKEKEREKKVNLACFGSLPKWLQQLGLVQVEARGQEPQGDRIPSTFSIICCSLRCMSRRQQVVSRAAGTWTQPSVTGCQRHKWKYNLTHNNTGARAHCWYSNALFSSWFYNQDVSFCVLLSILLSEAFISPCQWNFSHYLCHWWILSHSLSQVFGMLPVSCVINNTAVDIFKHDY